LQRDLHAGIVTGHGAFSIGTRRSPLRTLLTGFLGNRGFLLD
jgi:hypothetical protein